MGRTAWTVAGGVVGAFFGYPQLGMVIGGAIGAVVDPERITGPRIGETSAQTSMEGAPRPIIYGTAPVFGNVIASGVLIKQDVETEGEKGGPVTSTEHCYRTYAIRICEGPIGGLLRVWEDEKLVYDVRPNSLMLQESEKWIYGCNVYLGDEEQLPDTFLEILVSGVGETPAYRGTAYMVFVGRDLTDRRGSIPQYRFEVASGSVTIPGPLIVYPWEITDLDPRNELNTHTYQYVGFAANSGSPQPYPQFGTVTDELDNALDEMRAAWNGDSHQASPPSLGTVFLVAYDDGDLVSPAQLMVDNDQEIFRLHYNEVLPSAYTETLDVQTPEGMWPTSGGLWGGNASPTASVAYLAETYSRGGQWTSPFRHHATETYTGTMVGLDEAFYTYDGFINVKRVPIPPAGATKIVGTAKQLAVVEYRGGELYQNGIGPVILPDDPRYNDSDFWQAQRDDAVDEGRMAADLTFPVVVSEYASGYGAGTAVAAPLGAVVADIHSRCGVPGDKFDVSELDDELAGLVIAGDYMGADAINTLRAPFFFDKYEADKKIWYPKRGAPVVTTLTIDDLVEEPDESERKQAIEYPKKIHLAYQHAASGYAPVKATYARSSPDVRVVGEVTTQVPVVFNENQAAQIVHKMFKVAYAEAEGEVTIAVPQSFLWVTPTDNIGLNIYGKVNRLRIEKTDHADGVLKWTLKHDRQSAYTSNLTGIPIAPPTLPPSTITGSTVLAVLDIASRIDSEDDLHILYGVTGGLDAWYGAMVQRSLDGGATYVDAASISRASVMGALVEAVPTASEFFTDTTNTVRVSLYRDGQTIESLTPVQFLSEGGAFALEKVDGSFEVMQYRDAVEESDGSFLLSYLHRGLLNSGPSAHSIGAKFVMLDRVTHVDAQSAWIGQSITHRAPSFDQSAELATPQTLTYQGRSQIEWPVAYLELNRDGSDIITATWTPRHRFGSDDAPIASVNFQGYRVTLSDGVLPAVSFDTTTPGFTYDASALGASVTVSVSALNRITGAGPSTSGAI